MTEPEQKPTQADVEPLKAYTDDLFNSLQYHLSRAYELGVWAAHLDWGQRLQAEGFIKTPAIVKAFNTVKRYDFMPNKVKAQSGMDEPLPIGYEQTISQPHTVGRMQEWLQPRRGHRILDFGSGSAWTTALMARIVGKSGAVIGLERVPELVEFGRANIAKYDLPAATIEQAGDDLGLPDERPFNRILVSAHLTLDWLEELQQQLNTRGGRLIAPLVPDEQYGTNEFVCDMVAVSRHGKEFQTETLAKGYGFVPVIHGKVTE